MSDQISKNQFAEVVTHALATLFPHDRPCFLARTPHGYHTLQVIRDELSAAGFRSISVETLDTVSAARSARDAAIAYCQGTPLRNEIEGRDPSRLDEATHEAAGALARRFGPGVIDARIRAHVVTATC